MSPEQLEGKETDARTDIFGLGAVLYEMATGKRAFTGKSQASLIVAILSSEPQPISIIQPMSPPAFDRTVKTCLAKDPDNRWQTARDVMLQLQWITESSSNGLAIASAFPRNKMQSRMGWIATGILLLVLIAIAPFAVRYFQRKPEEAGTMRFSIALPDNVTVVGAPAISPDGKQIVFPAKDSDGKTLLWVRSIDSFDAKQLPGTDDAIGPFWSPDSRSIGFLANGKLKRIELGGGHPQILCDAPTPRGGAWNHEGIILFAPTARDRLYRISSNGGKVTPVTALDESRKEDTHRYPCFLPDGRHFLYAARSQQLDFQAGLVSRRQPNRIHFPEGRAAQPLLEIFERCRK